MAGSLKQMQGKPGMFKVKTAKGTQVIRLVEWREDFIIDTVELTAGALALGAQWNFFQNINNKNRVDCNIATSRRLTSGTEMILNQIGVMPLHNRPNFTETTPLEFGALCERLHFELRINNLSIAQGPVHCFPSGLGATGTTMVGTTGFVTNGLASSAAVPRLLVPQNINSDNDISGTLTHPAAGWIAGGYTTVTLAAGGMFVRNTLRGYVKTAVGKG